MFQPLLDLRTARIAGFEALARFKPRPTPAERLVLPGPPRRPRPAPGGRRAARRAVDARPPGGRLPVGQRQPVVARPPRRSAPRCPTTCRTSSIEITENELVTAAPALHARSTPCASAARGSPSTTPAPATRASPSCCASSPTSSSSTARWSTASRGHRGGAHRLVRELRPLDRRARLRGGHRDAADLRARRPGRHLRAGVRHRPARAARGRRSTSRPPRRARPSRRRSRTITSGPTSSSSCAISRWAPTAPWGPWRRC